MAGSGRIGITPYRKMDDYLESLRRVGAEVEVLSFDEAPEAVLERVGGLVLTGGDDVDPAYYGAAPHPSVERADPRRDQFELELARLALARDVPVLAICRGVQVLNVAAGGTLVQDIASELSGALQHENRETPTTIAHEVWIARDSRLWKLLSEAVADPEACPVNSRHHQAVKDVAPPFQVSATAPDGVVEAIERPGSPLVLGVQWHPENFWRTGTFRPLFEAIVDAARGKTAGKGHGQD